MHTDNVAQSMHKQIHATKKGTHTSIASLANAAEQGDRRRPTQPMQFFLVIPYVNNNNNNKNSSHHNTNVITVRQQLRRNQCPAHLNSSLLTSNFASIRHVTSALGQFSQTATLHTKLHTKLHSTQHFEATPYDQRTKCPPSPLPRDGTKYGTNMQLANSKLMSTHNICTTVE